ncbi:MAG: TaqI-like C-terminal specificity domain-containing protein [Erysipelotrichales bacterium]|nr:TaqI-like C-terminal specificity domain-containing protein [Erysipelotrichales bacterium]
MDGQWFQYSRKQGISHAECEKLVAPEISKGGNFSYDKKGGFYSTTKNYGYIKKDGIIEDYKFWLGLLNSQLFWFFIQNTGYVLRGGYFTFKTDYVQPFPVPQIISPDIYSKVITAVDYILKMKEKNRQDDTSYMEGYIDKYIYSLYDLSKEDIVIIESDKHDNYLISK